MTIAHSMPDDCMTQGICEASRIVPEDVVHDYTNRLERIIDKRTRLGFPMTSELPPWPPAPSLREMLSDEPMSQSHRRRGTNAQEVLSDYARLA